MNNRLVSLLVGPTDRTKIFRFGIIKPKEYNVYLKEISKVLINYVKRLNIIPDEGVPLDLAKSFRILGGTVVGYVPKGNLTQLSRNFRYCTSVEEFDSGWS